MPPEKVSPASGEAKKVLRADCALLLKEKVLLPTNFNRFLANMFALMGNEAGGLETPELSDRSDSREPHVLSLENREGEVVVHILPLTIRYSDVGMGEMIYRDPRTRLYSVDRFLFNKAAERSSQFRSYLTARTAVFDGDDILFQTAELNPEQLVVFARKFFAAWQRSQSPYATA